MKPIKAEEIQRLLTTFENKPVYLHAETTNSVYANHFDQRTFNVGTFLRNIQVTYEHVQLKGGDGDPLRVGLKLRNGGWVYVQDLTYYEINDNDEFLVAGFNYEGQSAVTIEISEQPLTV